MFKPRPCGCKGIRTCLLCEAEFGVENPSETGSQNLKTLEFCHLCGDKAWEGFDVFKEHGHHHGEPYSFPGVLMVPDFITEEEEELMLLGCDSMEWDLSQSGRRKQNFGPKTNFKKRKINGTSFNGFPKFSQFVQDKFQGVELLKDFQTVEQCAIEYRPETGACIDPHIDDCWVWGERIISVNLLSDSVLTMTKFVGPSTKYNLTYCSSWKSNDDENSQGSSPSDYPAVRLLMPRRSLLLLYGAARYEWEHRIHRQDITQRRICMAYREFTPEYLPGGSSYEVGSKVLEKAKNFWNFEHEELLSH